MNTDLYSHAPAQINTVSDLITFFSGIPEDKWCVGTVNDHNGNHCAIGHMDNVFGWRNTFPILDRILPDPDCLVDANNGRGQFDFDKPYAPKETAKARVLAYLRSLESTSPAPSAPEISLALSTFDHP